VAKRNGRPVTAAFPIPLGKYGHSNDPCPNHRNLIKPLRTPLISISRIWQAASNQAAFPADFTLLKDLSLSEAEVLFNVEARNS